MYLGADLEVRLQAEEALLGARLVQAEAKRALGLLGGHAGRRNELARAEELQPHRVAKVHGRAGRFFAAAGVHAKDALGEEGRVLGAAFFLVHDV